MPPKHLMSYVNAPLLNHFVSYQAPNFLPCKSFFSKNLLPNDSLSQNSTTEVTLKNLQSNETTTLIPKDYLVKLCCVFAVIHDSTHQLLAENKWRKLEGKDFNVFHLK